MVRARALLVGDISMLACESMLLMSRPLSEVLIAGTVEETFCTQ
jgi:hypothetical protein